MLAGQLHWRAGASAASRECCKRLLETLAIKYFFCGRAGRRARAGDPIDASQWGKVLSRLAIGKRGEKYFIDREPTDRKDIAKGPDGAAVGPVKLNLGARASPGQRPNGGNGVPPLAPAGLRQRRFGSWGHKKVISGLHSALGGGWPPTCHLWACHAQQAAVLPSGGRAQSTQSILGPQ